jgi:hypothetical protein
VTEGTFAENPIKSGQFACFQAIEEDRRSGQLPSMLGEIEEAQNALIPTPRFAQQEEKIVNRELQGTRKNNENSHSSDTGL